MTYFILIPAAFLPLFIAYKIHRWLSLNKWRKQLERGDKVRFYNDGRWIIGHIKHFMFEGKMVNVRYVTTFGQGVQTIIPLKILVPVK